MTPSDDEIQEEIAAHLRMAIADKMARGASREEAERTARAEFGNVTHVAEVTREMRGGLWLERLGQDLRYGWRALRRTPAFTAVAVAISRPRPVICRLLPPDQPAVRAAARPRRPPVSRVSAPRPALRARHRLPAPGADAERRRRRDPASRRAG